MPLPPAAHLAAIAALVIGLGPAAAQVQDERARLRERAAQLTANLPPEAQPNEKLVYRTTDQGKALSVWVYWPGGTKPQQPLPAIVLYHGGGWTTGTPVFYLAVARHFVERGMIAVLPEYRVNESSGSKIPDSTKDARAAMRWVKAHAGELGIDPKRLVGRRRLGGWAVGRIARRGEGGSSERAGDRSAARSSGAVQPGRRTSPIRPSPTRASKNNPSVEGMALADLADSDPMKNLGPGYPPCIVFHGTADATVPFGAVKEFVDGGERGGRLVRAGAVRGRRPLLLPGPAQRGELRSRDEARRRVPDRARVDAGAVSVRGARATVDRYSLRRTTSGSTRAARAAGSAQATARPRRGAPPPRRR